MTKVRRVVAAREAPAGDRRAVEAGLEALRRDALLAHPTCTVYGLGAGSPGRDEEIRRLKGRSADAPLLRIAASRDGIRRGHPRARWEGPAGRLADAFWPGPLTLVLEDGSADGLAVRVTSQPLARTILAEWNGTMSSTSLNRSGGEAARTPEEARQVLASMPETSVEVVWLDAGALPPSAPSTILSLRSDPPRILREGAVPRREIELCLGNGLDG